MGQGRVGYASGLPPCTVQKDGSEWDVVSAITLFSKDWVKAEDMAYVDDADSPTTESEDFEGSDFEGSETEQEQEQEEKD